MHHWREAKRVIRYLKGTIDLSLKISKDSVPEGNKLIVYSDSDVAGDSAYKSTSGCIIFLNDTIISWFSRRQSITALSTTEAELIALGEALGDTIYWIHVLKELNVGLREVIMFCDNQSAINVAKSEGLKQRTKQIGVIVERLRDHIKSHELF